jgi:hypothetical protein
LRIAVPLYLKNYKNSSSQGCNAAAASTDTRPIHLMAALCRRRLSEGTSATLVQVGFQPVTNPLLEQTEDAYSFPIIRLFYMIVILF